MARFLTSDRPQRVVGSTGNVYYVSTANGRPVGCTCPDHVYRQRACKHMLGFRATSRPRSSGYANQPRDPGPSRWDVARAYVRAAIDRPVWTAVATWHIAKDWLGRHL